jgi:RNA polymerase sigma-70 factor (ECF subfamily)
MGDATLVVIGDAAADAEAGAPATPDAAARVRALLADHYAFVWRALRRLGLDASSADDAAQQVFVTASRKLATIRVGGERAYLFGIAMRVASDARRAISRRREQPWGDAGEPADPAPGMEERLDDRRARALLDEALEHLPMELRVVLILHEIEEMTMSEIAQVLELAPGTVASRLRRARQDFESIVTRMKRAMPSPSAKMEPRGGKPK